MARVTLAALAALAVVGAASAQSSVTLFGTVDATYQYGSGNVSNMSRLGNSGLNSSAIGFRGVEDLGGGLSASFWLEAGVNNDNGSGATTSTNNQSTGSTGGG
ncbi:MAG: porin, partial [Acidovorax sp.]|uniref:porin n=1 Tax=Acidovorax sp. TaxID=1872122 RepID=UPI0039E313A7